MFFHSIPRPPMNSANKIFAGKTLNFAHRGFTTAAPENSLAAFKSAMDLGVDGIELDVRTCKSGEVVVFHDPTLKRMTNGRGFVRNKTLAELKSLRLNSDNASLNEGIPTLEEVIDAVGERLVLNIEIKTNGLPRNNIESKVVEILGRHGVEHSTIISSFNPVVIRRLTRIDRDLLTGYLIDKNFTVRKSEIPMTKLSGAKAVHLDKSLAQQKLIQRLRDRGYYSVVWSVNDPYLMKELLQMGVDGIITDRPDLLKDLTLAF